MDLIAIQRLILKNEALPASKPYDQTTLLIDANTDQEAIQTYLTVRCQKPTTRNAVQRDLRKFAVFMHLNELYQLNDIKADDCIEFQKFLLNPPSELCGAPGTRPPPLSIKKGLDVRPNPDWVPFKGPLSLVSVNQTVAKIKALYAWLTDAGYLTGNPWKLIKPVTKAKTLANDENDDEHTRELPIQCIKAVIHYLDHGQGFLSVSERKFVQWRWFFYFYLYTAARISSGCTATIEDIYTDRKGQDKLTLTVKGTGIRRKDVPWIPELEAELIRYRESIGLPVALIKGNQRRQPNAPLLLDHSHLFMPLKIGINNKRSEPLSYNSVHGHIVALFRTARLWSIECPEIHLKPYELAILNDATGHWIRHGTATLLGDHAKHQLGHSSERTTDIYRAPSNEAVSKLRAIVNEEQSVYSSLLCEPEDVRKYWLTKLLESLRN